MSSRPSSEAVAKALVDYANALSRLPPDRLPDLVARTCGMLDGSEVDLRLVDISQQRLVALGSDRDDLSVDGTIAGRAYRTSAILVQPDGPGRRIWIPLFDSSERLGVLGLTLESSGTELSDEETALWSAVGSLVGEAVMANSAYGDDIALARGMQKTTLAAELRWGQLPPLTYQAPGVTVSGILEPAYDIAGDTFDYAIGPETVHLAILDAMGHGLEASRMANLAVAAYRHARRHSHSVDDMLGEIDEVISSVFGNHRFVTGQLAALDLARGIFRVVNAGHPQPLHFRDGRYIGQVDCAPCPPLGLGQVDTTVAEVDLMPGDAVLLYTDGVIESRNPAGSEIGEEWLADFLSRELRSGVTAPEALRQVVRALYTHTGPALHDDATMVLLRWEGVGD